MAHSLWTKYKGMQPENRKDFIKENLVTMPKAIDKSKKRRDLMVQLNRTKILTEKEKLEVRDWINDLLREEKQGIICATCRGEGKLDEPIYIENLPTLSDPQFTMTSRPRKIDCPVCKGEGLRLNSKMIGKKPRICPVCEGNGICIYCYNKPGLALDCSCSVQFEPGKCLFCRGTGKIDEDEIGIFYSYAVCSGLRLGI